MNDGYVYFIYGAGTVPAGALKGKGDEENAARFVWNAFAAAADPAAGKGWREAYGSDENVRDHRRVQTE
ncbi:MAG: hypothetical protein WCS54_03450 [Fibrobacteraceae bacterium]